MRSFLAYIWMFGESAKRFYTEKYTYKASALAFETLLALVPILSVVLYLMSIFPIFDNLMDLTRGYIYANFIPTSGKVIQQYLDVFAQQATQLPLVSILFSAATAVALILTVETSLNAVWYVKYKKRRFLSMLLYSGVLLFVPIFVGSSVLLSSYLFSLSWFKIATVNVVMLELVRISVNTFLFSVLYIAVMNEAIRWREGLLGGLVAAILFDIAKKAFTLYIAYFPTYKLIYGALSIIPIFLVWLYISWSIILYGALMTHAQHQRKLSSI